MPLRLKSGFMLASGTEGRLLMDCGLGDRVVSISRAALEAIADPPRSDEFRLQEYIEAFSEIASRSVSRTGGAGSGAQRHGQDVTDATGRRR